MKKSKKGHFLRDKSLFYSNFHVNSRTNYTNIFNFIEFPTPKAIFSPSKQPSRAFSAAFPPIFPQNITYNIIFYVKKYHFPIFFTSFSPIFDFFGYFQFESIPSPIQSIFYIVQSHLGHYPKSPFLGDIYETDCITFSNYRHIVNV